jgi:hypothetical protein
VVRLSFAYTPIQIPATVPFPNGQTVFRPYLKARLKAPAGKELDCIVHIDSGADQCVFPLNFAAALGLDTLKMPMQLTGGVGSTGNITYYETLAIDIPVMTAKGMQNLSFSTYAGFTAGLDPQGIGLLGQEGFFENFSAQFDRSTKVFHIDVP